MRVSSVSFSLLPTYGESQKRDSFSFEELFENFISQVNSQQLKAREVEGELSKGRVKNIEQAMFVIEKADLSLRLLVELRNKAVESYQEIMRMQV